MDIKLGQYCEDIKHRNITSANPCTLIHYVYENISIHVLVCLYVKTFL